MTTRRTELPGVGTKHTLELSTGDQLVVVEHRVGQWELARVDPDGESTTLLRMSLDEGSELGRILSRGEVEREDSRRQMGLEEFALEWVTLDPSSPLVGTTLREAGIRERTGVSVIALIRGERSAPSPPPETRFEAGDTLVLIGQREHLEQFLERFAPSASGG
ncbi:MAG: cation:proton antiporter regulatory subunit [Myxococcota bacterium]